MGKLIQFPRTPRARPSRTLTFAAFGELESVERAQARLACAWACAALLVTLALQLLS